MKIEKDESYLVPGEWLLGLKNLEKWLYDGSCFSDATNQPGKIRDWANWLNQGFFGNIDKVADFDDFSPAAQAARAIKADENSQ